MVNNSQILILYCKNMQTHLKHLNAVYPSSGYIYERSRVKSENRKMSIE